MNHHKDDITMIHMIDITPFINRVLAKFTSFLIKDQGFEIEKMEFMYNQARLLLIYRKEKKTIETIEIKFSYKFLQISFDNRARFTLLQHVFDKIALETIKDLYGGMCATKYRELADIKESESDESD